MRKPRVPKLIRNSDGRGFILLPGTRRKHYFGQINTAECQSKYAAWCSRFLLGHHAPSAINEGKMVSTLALLYIKWAKSHYVEDGKPTRTFKSQEKAALLLAELFADRLGTDIGPRAIITTQDHLVSLGWKRKSINDMVGRIKQIIRWCCKMEYLPPEQYAGLKSVEGLKQGRSLAKEGELIQPVEDAIVTATLPFLPPPVRAMVKLQQLCGMRPQDACRLRPMDLDRSGPIWLYYVPKHKTTWKSKQLIKAIPRCAQELLLPYLDRAPDAFCFSPKEAMEWRYENTPVYGDKERKTKVYPSEIRRREKIKAERLRKKAKLRVRGDHYTTATYRRAITYAIKRAEKEKIVIPSWAPNQLRHWASTEVSEKIGVQAAQRWLGHEHIKTTEIYTKVKVDELTRIAEELDRLWQTPPSPPASA